MQLFLFVRLIFIVLSIASFTLIFPIATAVLSGEFSVLPGFIIPLFFTLATDKIFNAERFLVRRDCLGVHKLVGRSSSDSDKKRAELYRRFF